MAALKVDSESIIHLTSLVEKLLDQREERRIGREEFSHKLNIEPETLDSRVRQGSIKNHTRMGERVTGFHLTFKKL
jgi:hypothetical protein